jgi:hypothetical protein
MKETRLAQGAAAPQQYQHPPAFDFPPPTQVRPSLLSRLGPKHYAAAAIGLLMILAVPFVVMFVAGGSRSGGATQPAPNAQSPVGSPGTNQGETPSGAQTLPSQPSAPPPATNPVTPVGSGELPGDRAAAPADSTSSDKAAKPRDKKAEAAAREKARRRAAAERALDN